MLVYLSGPIAPTKTHTKEQNIESALKVYASLIENDIGVFCPHLNADNPILSSISYDRWMKYDLAMVDSCDVILMLERWYDSPGAKKERDYALSIDKIVLYDINDVLNRRKFMAKVTLEQLYLKVVNLEDRIVELENLITKQEIRQSLADTLRVLADELEEDDELVPSAKVDPRDENVND